MTDDLEPTPSPWFCPHCEVWVGRKLDRCLNDHPRPRFPLYHDDVEFDHSRKVERIHRIRAKIRRVIGR